MSLGLTRFHIRGLNQERVLNKISQSAHMFNVNRITKSEMIFYVDFSRKKAVKSLLLANGVEIIDEKSTGLIPSIFAFFKMYGTVSAIAIFVLCFVFQSQFVFIYQINGTENLSKQEVLAFLKTTFSNKKNKINTHEIEVELSGKFDEISLVSCMIKGQALIVNIKEKLRPEAIYDDFLPIFAQKDGKITKIDLISGTPCVKVGDYVKRGDVLVEPYAIDTDGNRFDVMARADIYADIYNQDETEHFDCVMKRVRTGKSFTTQRVTIFGLTIYDNENGKSFAMFDVEEKKTNLAKNNFLPLKVITKVVYEVEEKMIEEHFEDVQNEIIQKSKEKALAKVEKRDKIIDEYYTIRRLESVTIVDYCVVSSGLIGGYDVC